MRTPRVMQADADHFEMVAAVDLSGSINAPVAASATGATTAGVGARSIGVLENAPEAGQRARIRFRGIARCLASAPIAANQAVIPSGTGGIFAASGGTYPFGVALETISFGATGRVLLGTRTVV